MSSFELQINDAFKLSMDCSGKDVNVCLVENKHELSFKYSNFTIVSYSKPWNTMPAYFDSCEVTQSNNDTLIVEAQIKNFSILDRWSAKNGLLRINRKWEYIGTESIYDIAIGTNIPSGNGIKEKITIPHVIYNDNPSSDPAKLVPHLPKVKNYNLVVEEHRLPIPAVNVEWCNDNKFYALTVFSMPSKVASVDDRDKDHFWTLGGCHTGKHLDILSISGVLAFNNEKDKIYSSQNMAAEYPGGGYLKLKPGDVLKKTLAIDYCHCESEGRGFRRLVNIGSDIYKPKANPVLTIDETIKLKLNALSNRWYETKYHSGFLYLPQTYEEGNIYNYPKAFMYGWTGQSNRMAWCALAYGLHTNDESWVNKGKAVLDCFASADKVSPNLGLRCLCYEIDSNKWWANSEFNMSKSSSRTFGEAISNMAECILLLTKHNQPIKEEWLETITEGASFLKSEISLNKSGLYPIYWGSDGNPIDSKPTAAGLPCVKALLDAYQLTGDTESLDYALGMLERYYRQFADTFELPFSRSTLDAGCEDKEAGIYFFLASYKAWQITKNKLYAEYAKLGAEWIGTFVYFWNTGFQHGSKCAENRFDSTYWPGVSVQNMHLDVFFPPYEVHCFGKETGNKMLAELGEGVMQAWTHGIAKYPGHWDFPTPGEQGEQFFQTNYIQGPFSSSSWRGGFSKWNPSWIIALVLQAAIKFKYNT